MLTSAEARINSPSRLRSSHLPRPVVRAVHVGNTHVIPGDAQLLRECAVFHVAPGLEALIPVIGQDARRRHARGGESQGPAAIRALSAIASVKGLTPGFSSQRSCSLEGPERTMNPTAACTIAAVPKILHPRIRAALRQAKSERRPHPTGFRSNMARRWDNSSAANVRRAVAMQ